MRVSSKVRPQQMTCEIQSATLHKTSPSAGTEKGYGDTAKNRVYVEYIFMEDFIAQRLHDMIRPGMSGTRSR